MLLNKLGFNSRAQIAAWMASSNRWMKVPSRLNPWWHVDYEMSTTLSIEAARALLALRTRRLRGRSSPGGSLLLVRRGDFMNEFVRARVELNADGAQTRVRVRIARPRAMSVFMSFALAFLFLGSLSSVIQVSVGRGLPHAAGWLPFLIIGPAIWAPVMGANYTSARSEANDLRWLINEALKGSHPSSPEGQ